MNDYLEAVASIVGAENIQTFGRIKSNFGVWVRNDEAAAKLHELDLIEVKSESLEIWPFVRQIIKVKLFGVPPFISNESIEAELKNHGTLKAPIFVEQLHGVSDKFKGIQSFNRTTLMSFEDNKKLPEKISVSTEERSYVIQTQVGRQKCFLCKSFTHKSSDCPDKKTLANNRNHVSFNRKDFPPFKSSQQEKETKEAEQAGDPPADESESMETSQQNANGTPKVNNKRNRSSPADDNKAKKPPPAIPHNPASTSEWKFHEWHNITQGHLNRKRNENLHNFLSSLPKNQLNSIDISTYLPETLEERKNLYDLLEELVSSLATPQANLKKEMKIVLDKMFHFTS